MHKSCDMSTLIGQLFSRGHDPISDLQLFLFWAEEEEEEEDRMKASSPGPRGTGVQFSIHLMSSVY